MPTPSEVPPALRTLLETGWSLARRAPSSRVMLARLAGLVDPAGVPEPLRDAVVRELRSAREEALVPLDAKTVEKALEDAWRRPPAKVLDEFDGAPLAVTAAAQVHRGVHDGTAVAVKVQRPGVAAAVRNDLNLLDALARPLGSAFPGLDTAVLLREVRDRVLDELDLEHEASTHRQAARALRRVEGVTTATAISDLAAPTVLVTTFLEGPTLQTTRPDDPVAVGRTLIAAHLAAARDGGLALADARPNHVVLLGGGDIGLLGIGAARPVQRARLDHAVAAATALRDGDDDAFAAAVDRLGVLPTADDARAAAVLARTVLGPFLHGPARLDHAAVGEAGERALGVLPDAFALAGRVTPDPADLWAARAAGQVVATLAELGGETAWVDEAIALVQP